MSRNTVSPNPSCAARGDGSPSDSQEDKHFFGGSQASNADSLSGSLESSFQLDSNWSRQGTDSEKHPKGRRKRTTNQDKVILEAAYEANPKPGKLPRLDLVRRVSLNEKEVQIWFQNRRQNDRRKSRPLTAHEIAVLRSSGGIQAHPSGPMSCNTPTDVVRPEEGLAEACDPSGNDHLAPVQVQQADMDTIAANMEPAISQPPLQPSSTTVIVTEVGDGVSGKAQLSDMPPAQVPDTNGGLQLLHPSQAQSNSVGYLANRWNVGSPLPTAWTPSNFKPKRLGDAGLRIDGLPSANTTGGSPPAQLLPETPSSHYRLGLSLDGKAQLVSSQSSSPPRPVPVHDVTLAPVRTQRTQQRSQSALSAITLPSISTLTATLPPRLPRGRSRDVAAWERCCKTDTRDELTEQAENESAGSALAAIGLLRSSSQSRHNVPALSTASTQPRPIKRTVSTTYSRRDENKRTKCDRSRISIARVQNLPPLRIPADKQQLGGNRTVRPKVEMRKKPVDKGSLAMILDHSGDSDKENWDPGDKLHPFERRRRRVTTAPSGKPGEPGGPSTDDSRGLAGGLDNRQLSPRRSLFGNRANTAPVQRQRVRIANEADSSVRVFYDDESGGGQGQSGTPRTEDGHAASRPDEDEVERFMRGPVSPSKRPDMDCIAGLLSLSQGSWR